MIYKMELSDSVDTMVFDLLEVPIVDKDITGIAENTTIDGNVFNDYLWLKKQYVQKWSIMCQDEYDRLRGFWTRQFGNAEVPFYRLFYGENVYEDKNFLTSDGFTQIMNPTERTAPLSLTHLYGNAEQETLSGKNLIPSTPHRTGAGYYNASAGASFPAGTSTYVTTSVSGDTINIACSATWVGAIFLVEVVEGQTYHIHFHQQGTGARSTTYTLDSSYAVVRNTGNAASDDYTRDGNITVESGEKYIAIGIGCGNPATTITVEQLQVELGSSYTGWQEYVGGIPSPNPDFPQEIKTVTGSQTVKITGKNLTHNTMISQPTTYAGNVVVSPNDDGTVSLNGTATNGAWCNIDTIYYLPNGANIANVDNTTKSTTAGGYTFSARIENGSCTFSYNSSNHRIAIYIPNGQTYNNAKLFIQVEKGNESTEWQPYQSQSQEINLGKNLWSPDNAQAFVTAVGSTTHAWLETFDGKNCVAFLAQAGYGDYPNKNLTLGVKFKRNTQYTISFDQYSTTSNRHIAIWYDDGTYTTASLPYPSANTWAHLIITTESNKTVTYITPFYTSGTTYIDINTLQIEEGTQATSYSAYKTPIELAKIGTYQDYIWNDNGTWKIHKEIGKVVLDGTESWWISGETLYTAFITDYAISGNTPLSEDFTGSANVLGASDVPTNSIAFNNSTQYNYRFYVRYPSKFADVSSLTTWLGTNKPSVYYALATPTDTEITDSELIEQLNHIYELYQGTNNVMLIPNAGAQGEIDGTYRLIYDEETDIIPKTPVVLTLTDGGVINPCGCRQNIQLIMRETEGE